MYSDKYTGVKISGAIRIEEGNEKDLMGAVANVGPVSVAIDGSSNAFRVCLIQIRLLGCDEKKI